MLSNQTEVIVVAPVKYSASGRRMVHEISKCPTVKAVFWSVSQYKDNEPTQTGDRKVIFIGDSTENELTGVYSDCIDKFVENEGAKYGFDGSKAIIYGIGDPDQNINFNDLKGFGKFVIVGNGAVGFGSVAALAVGPIIVVGGYAAYQYYTNKKQDQEQRAKQVEHGIELFIDEVFAKWINTDMKAA